MDSLPDDSDIPFCHEVMLQEPLKLHGFSRDECLVTCHCSGVPYTFPRPYLAFIKLLLLVNNEITQTWKNEDKEDQVYWTSLRAYLNKLLQNTLTCFEKKKHPMALACWLHREFMLCCHDLNGRREYLGVMEKGGVAPYSVDTFELGEVFSFMRQLMEIHSNIIILRLADMVADTVPAWLLHVWPVWRIWKTA